MEENEFRRKLTSLYEFFDFNNISPDQALELMMHTICVMCILLKYESQEFNEAFNDLYDHLKKNERLRMNNNGRE